MRKNWKIVIFAGLLCLFACNQKIVLAAKASMTNSPDGKLNVAFQVNEKGQPVYSIQLNSKDVIKPSPLGLIRDDKSFAEGLTLDDISGIERIEDNYTMLMGKRKKCSYVTHRRVFTLKDSDDEAMQIIFQISNDGVAFRYAFPEKLDNTYSIEEEKSAFAFEPNTVSWLHPMQPGKSGWSRTQPSYEEHYEIEAKVGRPSPIGEGWCMPALFKTSDDIWVLICDSDVDESYCAVRLAQDSSDGVYKVAFPHPEEHRGTIDPVTPVVSTPLKSPWRVLVIGDKLNTIVESTLMTDVAKECQYEDTDFIKPGKAAWHWLRYGDDSSTLEYAESFLDFASKMKWKYMLIDANWDRFIGYEKMAEFIKKAAEKNVSVILWYNSNGPWNDAPMGPKNKMHEREVRRQEFAKIKEMGAKGVKVDFFGGDKQATMKFYIDIFKDAADYGILVNCHGATIPRGWQRTYPNLVTMEAVKGMEYCTFDQRNANLEAQHCTILPFTRNAIGSMDYTPTVFNRRIRGVRLRTTLAFELALPVVFESGVQHLGLVPDEYSLMPDYVVNFLQEVPTVWDQTRFIEGYPGRCVVIARNSGDKWYIAGINGTGDEMELSPDLSFLPAETKAVLISDGTERTFSKTVLEKDQIRKPTIKLQSNGGFVIVTD